MNEINLPSDNFHKFKAFAGLALVVIAVTIPTKLVLDLVDRATELNGGLSELEMEVRWHLQRSGKTSQSVTSFELADVPVEVAKAQGRLAAQRRGIEEIVSMEKYIGFGAVVMVILGTWLLAIGFRSWHEQQKKLDALLDHQLKGAGSPSVPTAS